MGMLAWCYVHVLNRNRGGGWGVRGVYINGDLSRVKMHV